MPEINSSLLYLAVRQRKKVSATDPHTQSNLLSEPSIGCFPPACVSGDRRTSPTSTVTAFVPGRLKKEWQADDT
jgi:hypothetical protein